MHRNLAKFAGAVYFSWMNPRAQDHKQPGDNTVVHWRSFKPTLDAAVRVARNFGRVFSDGIPPPGASDDAGGVAGWRGRALIGVP